MMVAVPLFLPTWFVQLQSESGVLVFWKYILFVLFSSWINVWLGFLAVLVIGHSDFQKSERLLAFMKAR